MLFAIIALALQLVSPAFAYAPAPASFTAPAVAAAGKGCVTPNADVAVAHGKTPDIPKGEKLHGTVTGTSRVTIGPNGEVVSARIERSTGDAAFDQAVLNAAKGSTYSPKIVDCKPVQGAYLFSVLFDLNQ